MNDERPYLELPLPSDEDYIRFKEWQKNQQEEKEEKKDQGHVIVIDI